MTILGPNAHPKILHFMDDFVIIIIAHVETYLSYWSIILWFYSALDSKDHIGTDNLTTENFMVQKFHGYLKALDLCTTEKKYSKENSEAPCTALQNKKFETWK